MCIFFTADTHFGHRNILQNAERPFEDIIQHDEVLVSNWNSVVSKKDIIFHLGDFALCKPCYAESIIERLNGQIFLIKGNHDKTACKPNVARHFQWIKDACILTTYSDKKVHLHVSHYPFETWYRKCYDSYHLHGHCHGKLHQVHNRFDVGVDCHNYYPVSIEEITKEEGFEQQFKRQFKAR